MRHCREHGSRVYLADWRPAPPQFGLADYAGRLILACLDAARIERAVLLAHSLGGLFAAIFAALHPERVQGLALLAAPLHFGAETPVFNAMVTQLDAGDLPESLPGSFLSAASANAAPDVFAAERLADALLSAGERDGAASVRARSALPPGSAGRRAAVRRRSGERGQDGAALRR